MKNILEVCGLNKSYRNFALQDVSFSLPEGCITGREKETSCRAKLR